LQLAQAYSAIANGGVLMQPNIIKKISGSANSHRAYNAYAAEQRVINPATARLLTDMLQEVVTMGGTGTRAAVPGFDVAGKTGTARKIYNGTYSNKHLVASFAGFCPVDDPKITVVVIIDEPKTMSYGGQSAAPTFSRISQQVLNYMNVAPRVQLAAGAGTGQEPEHTFLEADRSG
jgi:cell division protein FtsI (penicillin-binding protein 3)